MLEAAPFTALLDCSQKRRHVFSKTTQAIGTTAHQNFLVLFIGINGSLKNHLLCPENRPTTANISKCMLKMSLGGIYTNP